MNCDPLCVNQITTLMVRDGYFFTSTRRWREQSTCLSGGNIPKSWMHKTQGVRSSWHINIHTMGIIFATRRQSSSSRRHQTSSKNGCHGHLTWSSGMTVWLQLWTSHTIFICVRHCVSLSLSSLLIIVLEWHLPSLVPRLVLFCWKWTPKRSMTVGVYIFLIES